MIKQGWLVNLFTLLLIFYFIFPLLNIKDSEITLFSSFECNESSKLTGFDTKELTIKKIFMMFFYSASLIFFIGIFRLFDQTNRFVLNIINISFSHFFRPPPSV